MAPEEFEAQISQVDVPLSEVDGGPPVEAGLIYFDHLRTSVEKFPNEAALIACHQNDQGSTLSNRRSLDPSECLQWSYKDLWDRAHTLAKSLVNDGAPRDRRFAVLLRNQAEWAICFWCAIILGLEFVPMHPSAADSPLELKHKFSVTNPGILVVDDKQTASKIGKILGDDLEKTPLKIVAGKEAPYDKWLTFGSLMTSDVGDVPLPHVGRSPDDIICFYFSGGTTGLPKPAPMTSACLTQSAAAYMCDWHAGPGRRLVGHLPSFHQFSSLCWAGFWYVGGCVVYPAANYSPSATLDAIEYQGCTDMPANPAMIDAMLNHPSIASRDLSSLHLVCFGGSVVHGEVLKKCMAPPLGARFATVNYGMSEGCPFSNWDIHAEQPEYQDVASVGHVLRGARARICIPGSKEIVPWGEIGELHMGNQFIVSGFPGRDESYLYEDAGVKWVITGDQAKFGKHGELYILGRYKDLIIRGGRNISPSAVEAVVNLIPGLTCLVVGLPDEIAGEVPVAVVRCRNGFEYEDTKIRVTVAQTVGQYAAPQKVLNLHSLGLSEFPLTRVGKADKRLLKDLVHQYYASIAIEEVVKQTHRENDTSPSKAVLAEIWAGLTARRSNDISVTEPVTAYADSLLLLQATNRISKKTGKTITAEEILTHPTIEEQSKLLDRRTSVSAPYTSTTTRTGPPDRLNIAHVHNDPVRYQETKTLVEDHIAPLGFEWSDVQDVLPCYDNGRFMLESARRLQSWGHRFSYIIQATPTQVKEAVVQSISNHPLFRSAAVRYDPDTWVFACLNPSSKVHDQIVRIVDENIPEEQLANYRYNNPDFDHASSKSFLFKSSIIPFDCSMTCALIINSNHCMYDAVSFSLWLEDFEHYLRGDTGQVATRNPYKHFADAYYLGRNGIVSQSSCNFFVRKL